MFSVIKGRPAPPKRAKCGLCPKGDGMHPPVVVEWGATDDPGRPPSSRKRLGMGSMLLLPDVVPPEPAAFWFDPVNFRSWAEPQDEWPPANVTRECPLQAEAGPGIPDAAPIRFEPNRMRPFDALSWRRANTTAPHVRAEPRLTPDSPPRPPGSERNQPKTTLAVLPHRDFDSACRIDPVVLGELHTRPAQYALRLAIPRTTARPNVRAMQRPGAETLMLRLPRKIGEVLGEVLGETSQQCAVGKPLPFVVCATTPRVLNPSPVERHPPAQFPFVQSRAGRPAETPAPEDLALSPPLAPPHDPAPPGSPVRRRFRAWQLGPLLRSMEANRPTPDPPARPCGPDPFRRRPLGHPVLWRLPVFFDAPRAFQKAAKLDARARATSETRLPTNSAQNLRRRVLAPEIPD